jgi:hypothetical protein
MITFAPTKGKPLLSSIIFPDIFPEVWAFKIKTEIDKRKILTDILIIY